MEKQPRQAALLYVGTYTRPEPHVQGHGAGIYCYHVDPRSGALTLRGVTAGLVNPSYIALGTDVLYAVNEVAELDGAPGGALSAFAIGPRDGALAPLNRVSTGGATPCYVSLARQHPYALVANYGGGSVALLALHPDGAIDRRAALIQHQGSGPNPDRQEAPHAHCTLTSPDGRLVLVADLGLDRIMLYNLDAEAALLTPHDPPWVQLARGAGPRHLAFGPDGRVLYCVNELDSTITTLSYEPATGELHMLQTLSTLPPNCRATNIAADVHVGARGTYVYTSNRGHDSIAVFAAGRGGVLTPLAHVPSGGRTPRSFVLDPEQGWLYVANQDSDSIITLRIDPSTGIPQQVGPAVTVPSPVCLKLHTPN